MAKKKRPGNYGQPRRTLTREEIIQVEGWSKIRLPVYTMAGLLGISKQTLIDIIAKSDTVSQAIQRGRDIGKQAVTNTLFMLATMEREVEEVTEEVYGTGKYNDKGEQIMQKRVKRLKKKIQPDPASLKFWLQTQEGFKITESIELTGKDGGPIQTQEVMQSEEDILAAIMASRKRVTEMSE